MLLLEVLSSLSKAVPESILASIARVTASHGCTVVHCRADLLSLLLFVLILAQSASSLRFLGLPRNRKEVALRVRLRMLSDPHVSLSGSVSTGREGTLVFYCCLGKLLSN